jgi:hypothetical protein
VAVKDEVINFDCGRCGKPIPTVWDGGDGCLLTNNREYELFGEVFFHVGCLHEHIEGWHSPKVSRNDDRTAAATAAVSA